MLCVLGVFSYFWPLPALWSGLLASVCDIVFDFEVNPTFGSW